jgi:hypothetical protein
MLSNRMRMASGMSVISLGVTPAPAGPSIFMVPLCRTACQIITGLEGLVICHNL